MKNMTCSSTTSNTASVSWLLAVSLIASFIASPCRAQMLPGLDEKPEIESPLDSMLDCAAATNAILANPTIRSELNKINTQYLEKGLIEECQTQSATGDLSCDIDFALYDQSLKTECLAVNGRYDEREHQIGCQEDNGDGTFLYKVTNYPTCYAANCELDDLERFIAGEVDVLERSFEETFGMSCDAVYKIEDANGLFNGTLGEGQGQGTTCLLQVDATPDQCGPLETNTVGRECDCYTFCDGNLVGCQLVGETKQIECEGGVLVAGCTYELFGKYDVQQSSSHGISLIAVATLWTLPLSFL